MKHATAGSKIHHHHITHAHFLLCSCSLSASGKRVFDVNVEGTLLPGIDIVALGGGVARKVVTRQVSVVVSDKSLTVHFHDNEPYTDNPTITAIEVNRSEPTPQSPPVSPPIASPVASSPAASPLAPAGPFQPILINCGGAEYTDTQGRSWIADSYFTGGDTYSNTANNIMDTADDELYQGERWGEFSYEIPIPDGEYEVVLHLAEI